MPGGWASSRAQVPARNRAAETGVRTGRAGAGQPESDQQSTGQPGTARQLRPSRGRQRRAPRQAAGARTRRRSGQSRARAESVGRAAPDPGAVRGRPRRSCHPVARRRPGPRSALASAAPAHCLTCGFMVRLSGPLGRVFGACANEFAPDDGKVVSVDHGCGAHSDGEVPGRRPGRGRGGSDGRRTRLRHADHRSDRAGERPRDAGPRTALADSPLHRANAGPRPGPGSASSAGCRPAANRPRPTPTTQVQIHQWLEAGRWLHAG